MTPLRRATVAGGAVGSLAALVAALGWVLLVERHVAQGLVWLPLVLLRRWVVQGLLLGALVGAISALPLTGAPVPPPSGRRRAAALLAGVASLAALLGLVFARVRWPQYRAESSLLAMALHLAGLALASGAVSWALVRAAGSPSLRPRKLALALALPLAGIAAAPSLAPRPVGPDLILLSVDTLRPDRLSCYGYPRPTPNVDALCAAGTLWETVIASAPVTLTATATLMTGLDPPEHGAHYNGFYKVRRDALTLAELLAERGYATGAVIGNFALDRASRIDQGFASFDDQMTQPMRPPGRNDVAQDWGRESGWWGEFRRTRPSQRFADEITDAGIRWLESRGDEPVFLWLHYMDPHKPYAPPAEHAVGDPYDGEVAFVDDQIGRMLRAYDRVRPGARAVVAFVADHGESLGEHDYTGHVKVVYEQTLRVPLIVAVRGGEGRRVPERIREPLRAREVPGLLLAALGVEPPAAWRAAGSGGPEGDDATPWHAYAETYQPSVAGDEAPIRALRERRWKLVQQRGAAEELYDLEGDPAELANVAERHPGEAERLRVLLRRAAGGGDVPPGAVDPETHERLRALGYVP